MRSVLGIFPHPDDEAYAAGGALALAARAGARMTVVCATRGERGEHLQRRPADHRSLAEIRTSELESSCRTLGAEMPRFLDLSDGSVSDADFPTVVAAIVRLIRELRPDVIISLGADGVYGHPDHIALYRLVVAAVRSAAGGDRFALEELGSPFTVPRILYCAFEAGLFRPQYERMLTTDLAAAMRLTDPNRLGTPRGDIRFEVPIAEVAEVKLAAIACHQSQLSGGDPRDLFPQGIVDQLLRRECFTSDNSDLPAVPAPDLFVGM